MNKARDRAAHREPTRARRVDCERRQEAMGLVHTVAASPDRPVAEAVKDLDVEALADEVAAAEGGDPIPRTR